VSVRSFVDLRAFAAQAAEGGDLLGGTALPLPDGPVSIAAARLSGGGHVAAMPADQFVIVLAGTLTINGEVLEPTRSIVLPAGIALDWQAEPGTLIIAMRCTSGPPGADRPVPIDHDAPLEPSGAPLAELLVGATPACRNHTDYRSATGEFLCGTWDSTPYFRLPMRYRHYELMHLLDGAVTFVDEAGRTATFTAGDIFLVEQGAECSWESKTFVKKVYAIYRPT
jgi:uncharacterized cupin superfamily protein